MNRQGNRDSALSGRRVLDLADEKGMLCSRQLMRFPWAEITSIPRLVDSPQLRERNFFIEVEHPQSGKKYKFPGAPCKLSCSPWQVGSRLSKVGEHNKEIYHQELGLSETEIKALIRDGVI